MKNLKHWLTILPVSFLLLALTLFAVVKAPNAYSLSERRALAQLPALTADSVSSGKFMTKFEEYAADQFPLREGLRYWKSTVSRQIFRQKDNHDIYSVNGYVSKLDYPMNEEFLSQGAQRLERIHQRFLEGTNCKVYLSIIPDKNRFLAPLGNYPAMDYDAFAEEYREKLAFAEYIDLYPHLTLEDFYRTDQHWRQEILEPIADVLADGMGAELSHDYEIKTLDTPFYGAYCGQAAQSFPADTIQYLTNEELENCTVTLYDSGGPSEGTVYGMSKGYGKDPYDLFLSGAQPLVVIENPKAASDRELVIFRDSFTSSLAPLLASGYRKITLVDLRYLKSGTLGNYIEFDDQDVLFLYSTLILNSSVVLGF